MNSRLTASCLTRDWRKRQVTLNARSLLLICSTTACWSLSFGLGSQIVSHWLHAHGASDTVILRAALEAPLRRIAMNAGEDGAVAVTRIRERGGSFGFNAFTLGYEDLDLAGVMDPAKVTRCALQNAVSVGALVLTTDAIVVDAPEPEPPADAAEGHPTV